MPAQCDSYWNELRCQLIADHHSAHAAGRSGDVVFHWADGVASEYKSRAAYEWFDDQVDE